MLPLLQLAQLHIHTLLHTNILHTNTYKNTKQKHKLTHTDDMHTYIVMMSHTSMHAHSSTNAM